LLIGGVNGKIKKEEMKRKKPKETGAVGENAFNLHLIHRSVRFAKE